MAYVGLIIAAVAAVAKAYQDKQVARKQSTELLQGLTQQQEAETKARAKISANLQQFAPQKAADTKNAEQQDYLSQVQQAMGQNGPYQADQSLGASVALSNKRGADTAAKDDTLAKLFGTIGAAGTQRQNENIGTAQVGDYLNQVAGSANRQMQAKQLQAQSIRANPWTRLILNFAEAYGMGKAGGGAGALASSYNTNSYPGVEGSAYGNGDAYAGYA